MDSSVAFMLENIDSILIGAESVVENGGVINRVTFIILYNII